MKRPAPGETTPRTPGGNNERSAGSRRRPPGRSHRSERAARSTTSCAVGRVRTRRENEIALGEPVDLVRPDGERHLAPREMNVGVVSLALRDRADAVREGPRRLEIGELVRLLQVM